MFKSNFDKLLDKATSNLLMDEDWKSILDMCSQIRQNDVKPKQVFVSLKKKLMHNNPNTSMYAITCLESMVKNCGAVFHEELLTKPNCEMLHEVVKTTPHQPVRQKMLELLQAWNYAFRKHKSFAALKDTINAMKAEGFKFPAVKESDAMFSVNSAPAWVDGEVCHRCRTAFNVLNRKHHCRNCGQVFCNSCTGNNVMLPDLGFEKDVRVCNTCYEKVVKANSNAATKDAELEEYQKSSLAQQSQAPARKTEEEIREDEELQLALALSQSEAEAKEKSKMRSTSAYYSSYKDGGAAESNNRSSSTTGGDQQETDGGNPELARYLNRSYWEGKQQGTGGVDVNPTTASPSAPVSSITSSTEKTTRENGYAPAISMLGRTNEIVDADLEEFVRTLKSQVEIFINRMKSNSSRGRSIVNDSSVETLFLNITSMHSKLLGYIQQYDDSRLYYERQQDKLTQMKDARAALDALREEHRDKLRRQAEEAERQRQMMMAQKLDIMRKKKQQYLQYQRQLALQRIQEQEHGMQMRQEQQKQQYIMGPGYYSMGSPVHAPQYPPQSYVGYPSMGQGPPPSMPQQQQHPPNAMMPPGAYTQQPMGQPQPQAQPQQQQQQQPTQATNQMPMGGPPSMAGPPGMQAPPPLHHPPMQQQQQQQPYSQQPGAPPASPQAAVVKQEDAQTAELIFFD